jgi:hypothetical protein
LVEQMFSAGFSTQEISGVGAFCLKAIPKGSQPLDAMGRRHRKKEPLLGKLQDGPKKLIFPS